MAFYLFTIIFGGIMLHLKGNEGGHKENVA